jgi:hypothetical protein
MELGNQAWEVLGLDRGCELSCAPCSVRFGRLCVGFVQRSAALDSVDMHFWCFWSQGSTPD